MKQAWEAYAKATGCSLEVELVAMDLHELYNETIQQQGLKKGVWDIAHINTDWVCEAYTDHALCDLAPWLQANPPEEDRKSTRLNSSHVKISYAVFCLKKKSAACPA